MPANLADLEAFAKASLGAAHYPDDVHTFSVFSCDRCGGTLFELTIEHHSGSEPYDFAGIISGLCAACGASSVLFGVTGDERQPERRESPMCACGAARFYTALCERYEGATGFAGWFDEGVIAGQCAACGRNRVLVNTD